MNLAGATAINLPRRTDRLRHILIQWTAEGPGTVPLTVLRASELDPPARPLACLQSHIRALSTAPDGPLLVLEDDAVLAPGFAAAVAELDPPPDCDVLLLGGRHLAPPTPVAAGIVEPVYTLQSHAYIARDPAGVAEALMEGGRAGRPGTHVDLLLGMCGLRRYAVDPWLAGQDPELGSDVSGSRRSS